MKQPLEGIRVIDLTRVLAGPFCTMILGDLGAEVIKIERPKTGDDTRAYGPFIKGESGYFMSVNRNKKSITLNLKSSKGKEILEELIKKSDILVENFRPGTMERLGFGYENIKLINPSLIYAAISGFGHSGPYYGKPAYDLLVQAMGGIMSITGEKGRPPVRVGSSIGDITAALFGTIGILAALNVRKTTGEGQKIDVAMLDCQITILENAVARYLTTGKSPEPLGSRHPSIAPFQAYTTEDYYIVIACGNDSLWVKLCHALGLTQYIDAPKFKTNKDRVNNVDELEKIINGVTKTKTTKNWLKIFDKMGIPAAPINTVDKAISDPQIKDRNMIIKVKHPIAENIKMAGNPIKMSLTPSSEDVESPPLLGQHNEWVLREVLEYNDEEILSAKEKEAFR